jgi:hypothetical protein
MIQEICDAVRINSHFPQANGDSNGSNSKVEREIIDARLGKSNLLEDVNLLFISAIEDLTRRKAYNLFLEQVPHKVFISFIEA